MIDVLGVVALHDNLLSSGAVNVLLVNVPMRLSVRGEQDAPVIGRPGRVSVVGWIEGEPPESAVDQVRQPDVIGSCLRIEPLHGDLAFVMGERRAALNGRLADASDLLAVSIEPGQLRVQGDCVREDERAILRGREDAVPLPGAVGHLLGQWNGPPMDLAETCVEWLGQQRACPDEEQVARRRVESVRICAQQRLGFSRLQGPGPDSGSLVSMTSNEEYEVPAIRQELGPPVRDFPA